MNCKDAQLQIDERLRKGGSELPSDLRSHIDSCPACAAYLGELGDLRTILERSDFAVRPGELDDITFEKIVAVAGGHSEAARPRRLELRPLGSIPVWLWAPVAAAAAIVLMILIPRFTDNTTSTVAIGTIPGVTSTELINDIAESDSLSSEVLADMADDMDMDYIAETLTEDGNIDDMLYGLTDSEIEALYNKIDNSLETNSPGKG